MAGGKRSRQKIFFRHARLRLAPLTVPVFRRHSGQRRRGGLEAGQPAARRDVNFSRRNPPVNGKCRKKFFCGSHFVIVFATESVV